jgi:type IV pilus assembly protein PilM
MANKFFGLDIGTSSIKAVELTQKDKNTWWLSRAGEVQSLKQGLVSESQVDKEHLVDSIRKLVKEARISTNNVVCALPESQIFTRVISMPILTDKELASAIRWEAEQYIPVPLSDVSLAWQVLSRPDKPSSDAKMDLLLIAAPLILVDKYLDILKMSGLKPLALETELLAMTRALVVPNSPTTLVVSIGAFTTDITITKSGVLTFTRSIATGGDALTRALETELGFEKLQAEEYKKNYGLLEDQLDGKIYAVLKPVFQIIVGEIKKALTNYAVKAPDDPVKRAVVCGGGVKMPGAVVYLASELAMEVQVGDPWTQVAKESINPKLAEDRAIYAVATGLAMKPMEK